tara:strand:- start:1229 stop:2224 length:996 start_codon:yes stop_codon:yes gene_type:complete
MSDQNKLTCFVLRTIEISINCDPWIDLQNFWTFEFASSYELYCTPENSIEEKFLLDPNKKQKFTIRDSYTNNWARSDTDHILGTMAGHNVYVKWEKYEKCKECSKLSETMLRDHYFGQYMPLTKTMLDNMDRFNRSNDAGPLNPGEGNTLDKYFPRGTMKFGKEALRIVNGPFGNPTTQTSCETTYRSHTAGAEGSRGPTSTRTQQQTGGSEITSESVNAPTPSEGEIEEWLERTISDVERECRSGRESPLGDGGTPYLVSDMGRYGHVLLEGTTTESEHVQFLLDRHFCVGILEMPKARGKCIPPKEDQDSLRDPDPPKFSGISIEDPFG